MTSIPTPARNGIASVLSLVALAGLYTSISPSKWYILSLPLGLLAVAAAVVHLPALGSQVLARAVWWANLALGAVLALTGHGRELHGGGVVTLACGAALLAAGRRPLGEANTKGRAVPAALRGMLLLLMIFALADAQTFLLFATVGMVEGSNRIDFTSVMVTIGALYVAGFVGLYRLEIWGAILNIAVSLGVLFIIMFTHMIEKSTDELSVFLGVLAVVHLTVAIPTVIAVLRGSELPSLPARVRSVGATAVIVGVMLVATLRALSKW